MQGSSFLSSSSVLAWSERWVSIPPVCAGPSWAWRSHGCGGFQRHGSSLAAPSFVSLTRPEHHIINILLKHALNLHRYYFLLFLHIKGHIYIPLSSSSQKPPVEASSAVFRTVTGSLVGVHAPSEPTAVSAAPYSLSSAFSRTQPWSSSPSPLCLTPLSLHEHATLNNITEATVHSQI